MDVKKEILYDIPKVHFVFTENSVDNRHNRRKRKSLIRKQNKKNKKL